MTAYKRINVPITAELLNDAMPLDLLGDALQRGVDRMLHPWRYPDRNPMPHIVLFPRLERVMQRLAELRDRPDPEWS